MQNNDEFPLLTKCDKKARNQPHFTILAQDNFCVPLLQAWIDAAVIKNVPTEKISEAREILEAILKWRYANPGLCKIPD